ncbi:hypothetical protein QJQ45_019738, partial [Haematococcus lacustris]
QPPSHPSQSQLQGSSQHHPALPALLHLPGLSVLTRPATHPLALPAEEQQPIISAAGSHDKQFERMGQEVMEVFGRCGSAEQQARLLDRVLTSPQLQQAMQQVMQQCATTKQWVARLAASKRQVCVCQTCCNLDNLLTALAQHKRSLQLPPAAAVVAPLGCSPGATGAAPQPPPHQGVAAPVVTEEENESLTAAASPFIDPLGELAEQEHGWQAEHLEAIKAGKDGKVVISCDRSEKLTVECRIEIMSEHWHAPQIGILIACAYFKNKEGAYMKQTVYVMTDGKEQSAAITQPEVNQVVYYLLAEHDMDMRQLYIPNGLPGGRPPTCDVFLGFADTLSDCLDPARSDSRIMTGHCKIS